MLTPYRVYETLLAHPYPGLAGLTRDGDDCLFVLEGSPWRYDGAQWTVGDRKIPAEWPKFGNLDDADKVHWQIRGVLADLAKPSDRANAKTADAPLVIGGGPTVDILRTAIESIAEHVGAEPWALDDVKGKVASMQDRLTDEIDRRRDVEAQLAKMTDAHAVVSQRLTGAQREVAEIIAERDARADEVVSLKLDLGEARTRITDLESELAGARDAADHLRRDLDFMNQRRANAQKRVTDLEKQRDEYQAAVEVQRTRANVNHTRADKAEARVKRLLRQRRTAHAVLDEAGVALAVEGSPRKTLDRRCRAAVEPVWGYLDALQAFDEVGTIVGVKGKTGERGFIDAVIARVKTLHQGHAALAALLHADAADPAAVVNALHALKSRLKVLEVTAEQWEADNAPVKIGDRTLSPAERAAFVIRRLTRAAQNARAEAAALRAEQEEIAEALGDAPDSAERTDGSLVGLNLVEQIRARLT